MARSGEERILSTNSDRNSIMYCVLQGVLGLLQKVVPRLRSLGTLTLHRSWGRGSLQSRARGIFHQRNPLIIQNNGIKG